MYPANFEQSNKVFGKPESMTHDECECLSVFQGKTSDGHEVTISCWKPTKEELEEINKTGRIWCYHFGDYLQPHALSGTDPWSKG